MLQAQLNAAEHVVSFGGRVLDDDDAHVGALQLTHGSMLDISARLLGGQWVAGRRGGFDTRE